MKNTTKQSIIFVILATLVILAVYFFSQSDTSEYNTHMCKTYGYQSDCKTPLK
jgi:hypothetical protein